MLLSCSHIQVVQVYLTWPNTDDAPIRQLVGVKRQQIDPSKGVTVSVELV